MTRMMRVTAAATLVAVALLGLGVGAAPSSTPVLDWLFTGQVANTTRIGNTVYVGGFFGSAGPASGTLSHLFQLSTVTGGPVAGLPDVNGRVAVMASDGAGGVYLAGSFTNIGSAGPTYQGAPSLMRYAHVLARRSPLGMPCWITPTVSPRRR